MKCYIKKDGGRIAFQFKKEEDEWPARTMWFSEIEFEAIKETIKDFPE